MKIIAILLVLVATGTCVMICRADDSADMSQDNDSLLKEIATAIGY